ncbi:MAG: SAVED domain-containing protein [Candidatus Limnocylindria bacterium]
MTPFTGFLSYRRRPDITEVEAVERQIRLRGVRTWRDLNDNPPAADLEAIRKAIRQDTHAFVPYVTEPYLQHKNSGDMVWELEVPEANKRARSSYPVFPIFRSVAPAQLKERCLALGLEDFSERNGTFVPLGKPRDGEVSAERVRAAHREVGRKLLRLALMGAQHDGSMTLALRSFEMPTFPTDAALDLDWVGALHSATPEIWDADLVPALEDVATALASAKVQTLRLHVQARLPLALAFGVKCPPASGFDVKIIDRDGREWSGRGEHSLGPLGCEERRIDGDRSAAVLAISVVRDVGRDARALQDKVRAARLVHARYARADRNTDPLPVAAALACQVGDVARRLASDGVANLHLVLACPVPLAVLIGQQLHAVGTIYSYFSDDTRSLTRAYSIRA